jgi:hypothetical protein
MGFNGLSLFAASVFWSNWWADSEVSELMEQAQQEFAGTAQMYIKELWNLPIASILISFIVYYWLLSLQLFWQQLVPLLIIKPTISLFHYYAFSA